MQPQTGGFGLGHGKGRRGDEVIGAAADKLHTQGLRRTGVDAGDVR